MKVIDISRIIASDSVVWPDDQPFRHTIAAAIGDEFPYQVTNLEGWSTHFLTHMDAPAHFIKGGPTLDQIPLERFMGEVVVVDAKGKNVSINDVPPAENIGDKALFFKTRNSKIGTDQPFHPDFAYIEPEAAKACIERGATLVGIDYLSVDPADTKDFPSHHILLGAGVLVLEGLMLKDVSHGLYGFSALPLKIKDADGSPVRAVLMK